MELGNEIKRVWDENYQDYGARKAWHRLEREGFELARCIVKRQMNQIGIRSDVPGKVVETTIPDTSAPCPRKRYTVYSGLQTQICAGSATLPTYLYGRVLSIRPSLSTHSLIAPSDCGSRGLPKPTLS